jgi:hypothetical protein
MPTHGDVDILKHEGKERCAYFNLRQYQILYLPLQLLINIWQDNLHIVFLCPYNLLFGGLSNKIPNNYPKDDYADERYEVSGIGE